MLRNVSALLLLLAGAAYADAARATIFCVGTSAALDAAIQTAESNGQSDEIRVQIGVYTAAVNQYINLPGETGSLSVSGGWFGFIQACDTQFPDANLTRFDSSGGARGLLFTLQGTTPGALTVSNLSVLNATSPDFESAGVSIGVTTATTAPQVTINNVVVRRCESTNGICGMSVFGDARVLIRNVLVAQNRSQKSTGIVVNLNDVGPIQINHATVSDNSSFFGHYPGILVQSPVMAVVSNSVLYDNLGEASTDCDIAAPLATIRVVNSIVQQSCPNDVDPTSTNVMNVDPQFVGDGDFRLADASPARDAGVTSPTGGLVSVDLDGRGRTLGAKPDLGPFENVSLFANGFE